MRRKIYTTLFLFFCITGATGQEYYYWANNKKYPLELYADKQYIVVKDENKDLIAQGLGVSKQEISTLKLLTVSQTIKSSQSYKSINNNTLYWGFVNRSIDGGKLKSSQVLYSAPSFRVKGKDIGLSQFFYVKLKQEQDVELLKNLAMDNQVEIVGNDSFMPLWYILSCDKNSKGNALEMANVFYETGSFASAQPDLMEDSGVNCTNDPFFNQQWYLSNTGQSGGTVGNDIRICQAWDITMGCRNIVVAVLDQGLEFNHPDFDNISPISFDSETGISPATIIYGNHGVAVAGIIGATANNGLGVAGVAPNIQLMSINNSLAGTPLSRQNRAAGINFAWRNGSDVINNSWTSAIVYQVIDDAIQNAVTLGRNGLGTIVIFSSGNEHSSSISYPSNNPQVIAVGAIGRTGNRANFSNYGTGLDATAPGVEIYTTDRQGENGYNTSPGTAGNYFNNFDGTSSAAPQVSGIAALILSVNPGLTQQQVRNIIESTTDKVGNYTYTLGSGEQPTLTWNNQMGYGKVNAFRALQAALPNLTGPSVVCTSGSTFTLNNLPAGATITWAATPSNLFAQSSGNLPAGTNNFTLAAANSNTSGAAIVTLTLNGACGNPVQIVSDTFWVGKPYRFLVEGSTVVLAGSFNNYNVKKWGSPPNPAYLPFDQQGVAPGGFTWSFGWPPTSAGWDCFGCAGEYISIKAGPQSTLVTAHVTNACGTANENYEVFVKKDDCPPGGCEEPFLVYPNPSSEFFNVAITSTTTDKNGIVTLLDHNGQLMVSLRTKGARQIKIPVRKYKPGVYYISVTENGISKMKRVIITP